MNLQKIALRNAGAGSISNINAEQRACNASSVAGAARATGDTGPGGRQVIAGVVGAASSVTSVQVANLLRLFKIPQVSFLSTSPELSNKARFEYFMRTIPSDSHQVRAMVEIAKKLEWRYVSVIYEESNYGIKAFEDLETMLARNNICIAVKERLMRESGEPHDSTYDGLVQRLMARPRARGVIVFACEREVAALMAAVRRRGANVAFGWLGSDCWAGGAMLAAGNERALEGAIGVQLQAKPVRGFREYFLNLTVENNPRNPWFAEFWEQQFGCRYPGARAGRAGRSGRRCSGAERLASDTPLEGRLQFVGSLLTRNLADLVKKEHFILDSEYLTTLLVIVPKSLFNDWNANYEKITNMIVPRSTQLIHQDNDYGLFTVTLFKKKIIHQDNDYGLFTVTLFKKVVEEFKLHARERKFVVREFSYNEADLAAGKNEITKLVTDKKKQFGPLVRWLKVNFSECFCAWIHVKALRVFVESVLRYGLPVNFQAAVVVPARKSMKKLRDVLQQLYAHLDHSAQQGHAQASENVEIAGLGFGQSEYFPYVFYKINIDMIEKAV
ncbi:V-type proton ATPase subunit C [Papilio xuthus]|uniref:V-type proton ATPase subunit C n=1 Tax=Papilio xuthus TaxID=66420 RepID=A0A0N1PGM5_PAPXU|nr:V-type proton ATPase subunit C [Papilio xuthus]